MERTVETAKAVEAHFLEQEKEAVEGLFTIGGFSFAGAGQNMGLAFVRLKDWSERETPELGAAAVAGRAMAALRSEEHTSELQSLMRISYAVFCLKKKKKKKQK